MIKVVTLQDDILNKHRKELGEQFVIGPKKQLDLIKEDIFSISMDEIYEDFSFADALTKQFGINFDLLREVL